MTPAPTPDVSVVINTNRPAPTLLQTLEGLSHVDATAFDVIVVRGPDVQWPDSVVAEPFPSVRIVACPVANISVSRNVGIAHAAGGIVAFIDDDAVPEPDWLVALLQAFEDPEVAAVGGPVLDHTGSAFQAMFSSVTRGGLARSAPHGPNPSSILNAPGSWSVPTPMGTNSAFRRSVVEALGGFDEEIEYYLDESELCIRIVDVGYRVSLLESGRVHHKFLPSSVRGSARAVTTWFPIVKNAAYVAFRHGVTTGAVDRVATDLSTFFSDIRATTAADEAAGRVPPGAAEKLERVLAEAPAMGQAAAEHRAKMGTERFLESPAPPTPFMTRSRRAADRLNLCLLTREYPPGPVAGIGRVIGDLAPALADRGHIVRVVTHGSDDHTTVDFEDGVWVHRITVPSLTPSDAESPHRAYARAVHEEVRSIDAYRPVSVVYCPNWDSEGLEIIRDDGFTVALGLYTPLARLLETDPRLRADDLGIADLLADERECYEGADWYVACGEQIIRDISSAYGVVFDERRLTISPHGVPDDEGERHLPSTSTDVLVVGRLEPRKGTDLIIEAAMTFLADVPTARLVLAGDSSQVTAEGDSYPDAIRAQLPEALLSRVEVLGSVSDERLSDLYRACALVAIPSRFESFGLAAVEAMRAGKPVVVAGIGGLTEIVRDGETGLVVAPDDSRRLALAINHLLLNPGLRDTMGRAGREAYLKRYAIDASAERLERTFTKLALGPRRV